MELTRPDLSQVTPEIRDYIEALEEALETLTARPTPTGDETEADDLATFSPSEPPTTINIITISQQGIAKRTPRHLYGRQRRGGMGVFDIDLPDNDPPALLVSADEADTLVAFTNQGRTFRLPVASINQTPVRAKGQRINSSITLREDEKIVALIPDSGGEHIAIVGERGWVTLIRASFVGKNLIPGTVYLDTKKHGPLATVCWANRDDDLLVATAQGLAIRFPLARVSASGSLGIRLERDDFVVASAGVQEESGVFLVGDDGKGTIRLMSGFAANKNPGGGGKKAIKAARLAGMVTADGETDIFVISQHSKIIRFSADEVPPKTGVVQGVNCIALRGDEVVACTASQNIKTEAA